jgi:hypothetical protein
MDKVTKLMHNMQKGSDVERTMQNETIGGKCITRPMTEEEKAKYANVKGQGKNKTNVTTFRRKGA